MNILISGIGGPTPIGIARSIRLSSIFKKATLIGVDGNKLAPGLYNKTLFDKTYLIPHSGDDRYWGAIEALVKKEDIDYAFIVPETEVLKWSQRQAQHKLPCNSLIPDYNLARIFYDKLETANRLNSLGIVPKTIKVSASENNQHLGQKLGYPYWVRSGVGAGAIGSLKISTLNDLENWLKINAHIDNFLASEFLPGKNYACKVLCYEGKIISAASAERIGYLLSNAAPSGISGMCAYGKLVNNDRLINDSVQALTTLFDSLHTPPHGMFTVDFKEDQNEVPKITEINIRHVSFTHAFSLGGCNFVEDTLKLYTGDHSFNSDLKIHYFNNEYTFIRGVDAEIFLIKDDEIKTLD